MSRYDNDKIYATYSFDDETSQFDSLGTWQGGSECYSRTYRIRVPRKMLARALAAGKFDALHDWIEAHNDEPDAWL